MIFSFVKSNWTVDSVVCAFALKRLIIGRNQEYHSQQTGSILWIQRCLSNDITWGVYCPSTPSITQEITGDYEAGLGRVGYNVTQTSQNRSSSMMSLGFVSWLMKIGIHRDPYTTCSSVFVYFRNTSFCLSKCTSSWNVQTDCCSNRIRNRSSDSWSPFRRVWARGQCTVFWFVADFSDIHISILQMIAFLDLRVHGCPVLTDFGNDVPGKSISPSRNGYEIYFLQNQLHECVLHIVQEAVWYCTMAKHFLLKQRRKLSLQTFLKKSST